MTTSHLLEERHGELLVRDAVSGRADVFFGLICDVEVDPHQDVFLQKTEPMRIKRLRSAAPSVRAVLRSTLRRRP